VADITEFSRALPHIVKVDEFVPNEKVRMVANTHGTVWDCEAMDIDARSKR
jgi:hypothetical protein